MATNGINRIVRGNLNLKPFILSKNSTDIVNGYVQRLYQQLPENFKQELMKPRTAESQHETWALLKNLRVPTIVCASPTRVKANPRTHGNKAPMTQLSSRNNFLSAPRKLLKTPTFKIYNKRKYTSSASSSSASFQRNIHGERRKRLSGGFGITTRSITGSATSPKKLGGQNGAADISKYAAIAGRQFNAGTQRNSPGATTEVCNFLMPMNAQLKKKIRLSKPKLQPETREMSRQEAVDVSFYGWNHPSPDHLKKLTTSTPFRKPPPMSLDRGLLNLMEFKRVPVSAKARHARYETNNFAASTGGRLSAISNRSDCESFDRGVGLKSVKPSVGRIANNFKFGSRTTRTNPRSPRTHDTSCLSRTTFDSSKRETSFAFRK